MARKPRCVSLRAMRHFLEQVPWPLAILAALTLGLAPFRPPHVVEKLQMLFHGTPLRPIDWLDLAMHGAPWLLVILKGTFALKR